MVRTLLGRDLGRRWRQEVLLRSVGARDEREGFELLADEVEAGVEAEESLRDGDAEPIEVFDVFELLGEVKEGRQGRPLRRREVILAEACLLTLDAFQDKGQSVHVVSLRAT